MHLLSTLLFSLIMDIDNKFIPFNPDTGDSVDTRSLDGGINGGSGSGNNGTDLPSVIDDNTPFLPEDFWHPDNNLDNVGNLNSLYSWLYDFIQNSGLSAINSYNVAQNYVWVMRTIAQSVKNLFASIGYDRKDNQGAIIDIIEKSTNIAQSYLDQLFSQVLSYQAWYLQQEYNSPANQLKRLEQAGLSSAFVYANYGNTAQSAAAPGTVNPATAQMSGAGAAFEQGRANEIANRDSILGAIFGSGQAVADLVDKGVSSYKSLAEADNIRKMTPVQIASGIAQFKNLGVTYDYISRQIGQIENDIVSDWFKNDFSSFQQDVTAAGERVSAAQKSIQDASSDTFALAMGSRYIDTETYSGQVRDKSKNLVRRDYTLDQLESAWNNGGYDEDGNEVFTEEDYKIESHGDVSGKLGFPNLGFGVGASGGISASEGNKEGNKDTSKHGSTHDQGQKSTQSTSHYDDNTRTLTLGTQKFTRTTTRKLMNSKEYSSYMENLRNDLVKAKNDYFMLTNGERARLFQNYQMYLDNKAKGLKWSSVGKLKYYLMQPSEQTSTLGD